jgi:hypothetical protein
MKTKTLIAVAIAGAFAVPFAAQASVDGDRMILAQASSGAQGGATGAPGGAAAGSSGGQGSAGAPGTGPGMAPTDLTQLDKNNDGYVSREEASGESALNSRFSELDKDSDGRISRSEWEGMQGSSATGSSGSLPTESAPRGSAATSGTGATPPAGGPGVGGTSSQRQPAETGGK